MTGTVDFLEDGQAISSLAERQPSGTVTLLEATADNRGGPTKPQGGKDRGPAPFGWLTAR